MSHKAHLLLELLVVVVAPFAAWGLVIIAAYSWGARLRSLLPWLRTLSWVVWGIGVVLGLTALVQQQFWFLPFAASVGSSSVIFKQIERWVKRRHDPELLTGASPSSASPQA